MAKEERAEKLSVTLPKELAAEIRRLVPQRGMSAFFTEAAKRYLAQHRQRTALERGFGAWTAENHPELKMPEDTVVYVRSLREADRERLARLGGER